MTLTNFRRMGGMCKDINAMIDIETMDEWVLYRTRGYMCVQDGNLSTIYFDNSEGEIFQARSNIIEKRYERELTRRLVERPRIYYAFHPKDLDMIKMHSMLGPQAFEEFKRRIMLKKVEPKMIDPDYLANIAFDKDRI